MTTTQRPAERTGRLAPLHPQHPTFLTAWSLEVELQTARDADAEDWAQAARAAIVHPRSRAPYSRIDALLDHPGALLDHPGGPVPTWPADRPRPVRRRLPPIPYQH
jgi:hypothetical protein